MNKVSRRRIRIALLSSGLALGLIACGGGGGSGGGNNVPPTLQAITVAPQDSAIGVGMTKQFVATGHYSDSTSVVLGSAVTWTSSKASAATISTGGLATGQGGGTARISANIGTIIGHSDLLVTVPVAGNPTVWTFSDPDNRLAPFSGPGELDYRDPGSTGWGPAQTTFAKASTLGLPLMNGEDPDVMAFPATAPDQGYTVTHNSVANGVFVDDGYVSNYTLIFDVLWPELDSEPEFRALFQTDVDNSDDADMFVYGVSGGRLGIGINNTYNEYGSVTPGSWHRVAIAIQCALGSGGTGQIRKYIDGLFVGGQYTPGASGAATRCRWALDPTFHLFTDNSGERPAGFVSSVLYVDRVMTPDEIIALGGPSASGASVPGAPAPLPPQVASRRVDIVAHRAYSGFSPENTVAGIQRAFDAGADHIEVDVRKASGGELILMHDELVDRTTDGSGLASGMTLSALKLLDAGSWFDTFFAGEQVPTLVEALNAAAGRGRLLLDVKFPGAGAAIKQALNSAMLGEDAVWPAGTSDPDSAQDFKDNLPGSGTLWEALPATLDDAAFQDLKDLGVVGFDIDYTLITPEFVTAAHANGMFIIAYTVLDPDTMLELIELGVDGMETDYPAVLDSLMPAPLD